MKPTVYIGGNAFRLDPKLVIGSGGEADVYRTSADTVLKIFKDSQHPDFANLSREQQAADARIREHQKKLRAFPPKLPPHVITPLELATSDVTGTHIVGYTMPFLESMEVLLSYSQKAFRNAGISTNEIVQLFRDLHRTVTGLHPAGVVIGDFNDLNVLAKPGGGEAYLIDADSMQFGGFTCFMFTQKFLDPLLAAEDKGGLILTKPHNADSDWYAFAVMLFNTLLMISPYGGTFKPTDRKKQVPHDKRPMHRITVFHPEVIYPKAAIPFAKLPDDLLQQFHLVFEKDRRGSFPEPLLTNLRWTTCTTCGCEHARATCPTCATAAPAAIKETTVIRGTVTATTIFKTRGVILHASVQHEQLSWLYHQGGAYYREGGQKVFDGDLDPHLRFRIRGGSTLIGKGSRMIELRLNEQPRPTAVGNYGPLPIFDTNADHTYWVYGDQLLRDHPFQPMTLGNILEGQTMFWVGPRFGFGFYRAGNINVAFTFDAELKGLNQNFKLPPIRGQLLDATTVFNNADLAWIFFVTNEAGRRMNRCVVLRSSGKVEATAEAEEGDGSWLGRGIRGTCAAGNFLLVPTDEGIVRVEIDQGKLVQTKSFPDTEPFVDDQCQLFAGKGVLNVVHPKQILTLSIR